METGYGGKREGRGGEVQSVKKLLLALDLDHAFENVFFKFFLFLFLQIGRLVEVLVLKVPLQTIVFPRFCSYYSIQLLQIMYTS